MRKRTAIAAVTAALVATGCGDNNKCPTEAPKVEALSSSCTEVANLPVRYPLRLCPTCNQVAAACAADLSQVQGSGIIFLDVTVEACSGSSSCGPSCDPNPFFCAFNAPATPGDYSVQVFDGTSTTLQGTLTVIANGSESCATL